MKPSVVAVSLSEKHGFSKENQLSINLLAGIGVEGDAHAGKTVKHRFLAKKDPSRPNILQVHLIASELFVELESKDFSIGPGDLGENITTANIDLLSLPVDTQLKLGKSALVKLTALRNPCVQIDQFKKGLLKEVVEKNKEGEIVRKVGVMGVVLVGGEVFPNDPIEIVLPPEPHKKLEYTW